MIINVFINDNKIFNNIIIINIFINDNKHIY